MNSYLTTVYTVAISEIKTLKFSDSDFIKLAESKGNTYTLEEFKAGVHNGTINMDGKVLRTTHQKITK